MKKIYSSQDSLLINHLRNLLQTHDIGCEIKNDILSGAAGELPINETWPELWLLNPAQADQAEAVIEEALREDGSSQPEWQCQKCGENIEGQFMQCWQCGEPKP